METSLLFSDVQKKTSNPAPCSTGALLFFFRTPPLVLSLLPWHRRRKWLTLLTTVLTKTHIFKGRLICARKQTGPFLRLAFASARFPHSHYSSTSKQTTHESDSLLTQCFHRSFHQSSSLPPQSWLHFALNDFFCRHLALRLHFRLEPHANPRLDCGLTGF